MNLQMVTIVEKTVQEDIKGSGATGQERAPPPLVILRLELEITKDDSTLCESYHQQESYHN